MYFKKYNNFYHGIMFHHFHDGKKHLRSQGSIDQNDLYKLIKFINKKNILDANEFYIRLKFYTFSKPKLTHYFFNSSNCLCEF